MRSTLLAIATGLTLTLAACGDDHSHETLEDCVEEHTTDEGLPEAQAIVTCLVDHLDVSFTTLAECVAYVEDNGGYASADVACEDYLRQTGHGPDAAAGEPDASAAQ
jgi:hypothetical protein